MENIANVQKWQTHLYMIRHIHFRLVDSVKVSFNTVLTFDLTKSEIEGKMEL